jgi:YVTN family beta-propeller protein
MASSHCAYQYAKRVESSARESLGYLLSICLVIILGTADGQSATTKIQLPWSRLYVTNFASNTVSVIDLNLLQVIAEIPVGGGPTGMAVTPDVQRVYVANLWSGTVSVISTASNTVETTITIPGYYGKGAPFGMAITPDGSQIFVTDLSDGTVRVISTQTNTVTVTIDGAYDWALRYVAISPDGQFAYAVGTGDGKITVLRVSDYSVVGRITNLPGIRHLAITPDTSRLYAVSDKYSMLYVIDTATRAVIKTFQFPMGASTITIDIEQGGKFAMVSNFQDKVTVIDTDPGSPTYHQIIGQVPPNSGYQYCIVISPDGRFAYLSNQSDRGKSPNSINIIDIAPNSPTRFTIISSITVGVQPWGVAIVKQRPLPDREIKERPRIHRPGVLRLPK